MIAQYMVFVYRHFLTVKEMKKGPNKILLQAEDLLFIEPKAASCKVSTLWLSYAVF